MVILGAKQVGRGTAALIWGSIVLVLAVLIAYQLLIRGQGGHGDTPPDLVAVVPFVSGYMALVVALLWLAVLDQPRFAMFRPAMLASAAAGLLLLGVFALFSIGLPLFVAGVLAAIAAIRVLVGRASRNAILSEVAAAVTAVLLLVGGFEVTQRIIVCPPNETIGGGGSGFLTGPYHYECVNGTLTWHSGECNSGGMVFDANGNPISTSSC
jgi:hypothetical protein